MITVIGNQGCSRCTQTKNILTQKGIEFTYKLFNDFSNNEQEEIMINAQNKGQTNFPIILKNNEIITLEDVIA